MPRTAVGNLQNNLLYSSDFSDANWTKQSGVTVTANQAANPVDQAVDADLIDFTGASVSTGVFQTKVLEASFPLVAGRYNTKSVWLKGVVGGEQVRLVDPSLTSGIQTCNLTTSWQRFSLLERTQSTGSGLWIRKSSGNQFYAWGAQLVLANWEGVYTPTTGSYVQNMIRDIASSRSAASGRTAVSSRTSIS